MNPFVAVCEQNRNDFLRETKFETKNQFDNFILIYLKALKFGFMKHEQASEVFFSNFTLLRDLKLRINLSWVISIAYQLNQKSWTQKWEVQKLRTYK